MYEPKIIRMDLDRHAVAALRAASVETGKVIDSIGQTDLAKLTRDQWMRVLWTAIATGVNTAASLTQEEAEHEDEIPY